MIVGIIGLGRLGESLARGFDRFASAERILVFNRTREKTERLLSGTSRLTGASSAGEVFSECRIVFLWTKPADAVELLEAHRQVLAVADPLVVSCTVSPLFTGLPIRLLETLPNVNSLTGKGVTLIAKPSRIEEADLSVVIDLLSAVGSVSVLPREQVLNFGALTSCGPALFSVMTELLADTVSERHGYDRELCRIMVRETVFGTLSLQLEESIDASEVVYRVAHPGGSSEPGVRFLQDKLPGLFSEMLDRMGK